MLQAAGLTAPVWLVQSNDGHAAGRLPGDDGPEGVLRPDSAVLVAVGFPEAVTESVKLTQLRSCTWKS